MTRPTKLELVAEKVDNGVRAATKWGDKTPTSILLAAYCEKLLDAVCDHLRRHHPRKKRRHA